MSDTDPLKRLYRSLRNHVTQGVAGDVMQMPPSWGELLTAVHEAAFPDGDEEPEPQPLDVSEPIAGLLRGIAEKLDAGAQVVFLSSGESFAAGAKAQREAGAKALHADGLFHAGNIVANQPLVTDTDDDDTTTATSSTDDTTTATSGTEAASRMHYADGWNDGYNEGHAEGYRAAVERFAVGGEA